MVGIGLLRQLLIARLMLYVVLDMRKQLQMQKAGLLKQYIQEISAKMFIQFNLCLKRKSTIGQELYRSKKRPQPKSKNF